MEALSSENQHSLFINKSIVEQALYGVAEEMGIRLSGLEGQDNSGSQDSGSQDESAKAQEFFDKFIKPNLQDILVLLDATWAYIESIFDINSVNSTSIPLEDHKIDEDLKSRILQILEPYKLTEEEIFSENPNAKSNFVEGQVPLQDQPVIKALAFCIFLEMFYSYNRCLKSIDRVSDVENRRGNVVGNSLQKPEKIDDLESCKVQADRNLIQEPQNSSEEEKPYNLFDLDQEKIINILWQLYRFKAIFTLKEDELKFIEQIFPILTELLESNVYPVVSVFFLKMGSKLLINRPGSQVKEEIKTNEMNSTDCIANPIVNVIQVLDVLLKLYKTLGTRN